MSKFDIYTNRIPLDLLTPEERAALEAHDGEYELVLPCGRTARVSKRCSLDYCGVYRAIRPPSRPLTVKREFWEAFPSVLCVTRDSWGEVTAFTVQAKRGDYAWRMYYDSHEENYMLVPKTPLIDPGTCYWKDAIAYRPQELRK